MLVELTIVFNSKILIPKICIVKRCGFSHCAIPTPFPELINKAVKLPLKNRTNPIFL